MNTVETLPLNARSLAFRWNGVRYTLTLEAKSLKVDYQSTMYQKSAETPFETLSPELKHERWVPDSAYRYGKEARYLLLLAIVTYFSKLHDLVPLLAPVSLGLGLVMTYRMLRIALPVQKTQVRTDDGEHVVSIPHFKSLDQQRRTFEEILARLIKAANGNDLG